MYSSVSSFTPTTLTNGHELLLPTTVTNPEASPTPWSKDPGHQEMLAQAVVIGSMGLGSIRNEDSQALNVETTEARYDDMLNPSNILYLKEKFDTSVTKLEAELSSSPFSNDKRLDKDGSKANSLKEAKAALRQELINQYTQLGTKDGEEQEIDSKVLSSVSKLMDMSYEELEAKEATDNTTAATSATTKPLASPTPLPAPVGFPAPTGARKRSPVPTPLPVVTTTTASPSTTTTTLPKTTTTVTKPSTTTTQPNLLPAPKPLPAPTSADVDAMQKAQARQLEAKKVRQEQINEAANKLKDKMNEIASEPNSSPDRAISLMIKRAETQAIEYAQKHGANGEPFGLTRQGEANSLGYSLFLYELYESQGLTTDKIVIKVNADLNVLHNMYRQHEVQSNKVLSTALPVPKAQSVAIPLKPTKARGGKLKRMINVVRTPKVVA